MLSAPRPRAEQPGLRREEHLCWWWAKDRGGIRRAGPRVYRWIRVGCWSCSRRASWTHVCLPLGYSRLPSWPYWCFHGRKGRSGWWWWFRAWRYSFAAMEERWNVDCWVWWIRARPCTLRECSRVIGGPAGPAAIAASAPGPADQACVAAVDGTSAAKVASGRLAWYVVVGLEHDSFETGRTWLLLPLPLPVPV